MAFYITRPINGIPLNGVEYVRDENDNPIIFENMGKAKEFLAMHGYCETDIENEGIDFEEVNPVTSKPVTKSFHFSVNEETLRQLKEEYPAGSNIVLLKMEDEQAPPIGTIGKVKGVDSTGSILVSWRNNGSLNVVYGEDIAKRITLDPFAEPNPIHNVMLTLARKLTEANILYELEPVKDGWRINYVMTDSVLRFVRYSGFNSSKDSLNDNEVYMFSITSKEPSNAYYGKDIVSAEDAFFVINDSWNSSQSDRKSTNEQNDTETQYAYVCYEENYNDLLIENDAIQVRCIKDSFDEAYDFLCERRSIGIKEQYVADESHCADTKEDVRNTINAFGRYDLTMFLLEQENDKESYSIIIEKRKRSNKND